jgi:putative two-component system response regulator
MLQCSILDNGVFRGYVGFDECAVHRIWTQDQINLLQFLAEVLGIFLLKKRVQDRAIAQSRDLCSILDRQDAWIYVIDPDTCRLKFLNEKARQLAPEGKMGAVCYHTFMGRETRCENCPANRIREKGTCTTMLDNYYRNLHVNARADRISWNGEDSCLITCQEIPSAVEITK